MCLVFAIFCEPAGLAVEHAAVAGLGVVALAAAEDFTGCLSSVLDALEEGASHTG